MNPDARSTRRQFLKATAAWSALATLPTVPLFAQKHSRGLAHMALGGMAQALIVGDWGWQQKPTGSISTGGEGFHAQSMVARGMQRYAQGLHSAPDALFLLGDNWYGDLAGGVASPRWRDQFEQMYPAETFPGPAYTMLGNHDYQKLPPDVNKVEAELEYARMGKGLDGKQTRWTLPARWYTFDFPTAQPLVHFIVLDSNMPARDGSTEHGHDFTMTHDQQAEQLAWLKVELARPRTAPFLGVLAHHPVFSNGPHGDHPTLVRDWDPLFREHKVDLYMAGHDHDLQHLEFDGHPTTHFLSGGGGADLYVLKVDDMDRGPYAQEVHGFSHLSVDAGTLQLRHLDADGRLLYGITKTPGATAQPLRA